jgi:two-component system sensor histidine kinase/response regulator
MDRTAPLDASAERAEELFRHHQNEIYRDTDQLFARLMVVQWVAGIVIALVVSPRSWAGQASQMHIHVWAAIFVGGIITAFPVWMTHAWPGAAITRHVVAVAQMLMSALLIGLTGGRIETHFHVFGSLVILSFYRDWRVLIPATVVVGLDHFLRGIYLPYSVYGVLTASPWRSIEHAGWVIFEDIFLVISCLRSIREMRFIANRTAALETSERSFRQLFEEAPIGMAVVGLDERFTRVNAVLCKMIGYSERELAGRTPLDITYPEDIKQSKELGATLLSGAENSSIEKRYVHKDGDVLWAKRTACVIRDEAGKPRHHLVMVEDITQRKKTAAALQLAKDEAERANNAKNEFLSRMSHELRTPLNAILGFGQLLQRKNPDESTITHILNGGRHLLDLINEVLEISRIEAGALPLSLEPVAVSEALAEALDLMRPLAAQRAIDLTASSWPDPSCYVVADRQRLKQVLLNLLTNGVKYTPTGGGVTVSCALKDDEVLRISVADTGPGIPADKVSRLFTPFERLGAEQSDVQGTGLGLALCQRLIRAMRGNIGVQSAAGEGSIFWIELPRTPAPPLLAANKTAGTRRLQGLSGLKARTLLYIEDNLSNVTLVEHMLAEKPEMQLLTAMQGTLGISLAREHAPDLILLDLHLPDLAGWEVLRRFKADEATRHIPVVIVSADATARQIQRLMDAGASDYLTKPLNVSEFFRVIEEAIKPENEPDELVVA